MSELTKDYRTTEIGRQNWEVCCRMLVHDLIDLSKSNPSLAKVLDFYNIRFTDDGGYTMALPRIGVLLKSGACEMVYKSHKKEKKK